MLIALEVLILALCAVLLTSDTPIGNAVRALLIDAPAKASWDATPLKLIVRLIVIVALAAFVIYAPEWIMLFGFGDLMIYLDVGIILLLISAADHGRSSFTSVARFAGNIARGLVARWNRRRGRSRVSHLRKPKAPSSNDDEAGYGWALA
ncbi:MAG: hypothetical protein ACREHF_10755 [Rhizomicrobium sp.]